MTPKILSLNVGGPAPMEWNGKTITSSMLKKPIDGALTVHLDHIDGDSFANPQVHGTIDSVLYVMGVDSMNGFIERLDLEKYEHGSLGENITLDRFDEAEISVGDVFQFGEVIAQATGPRVPCGKVDYRMCHAEGKKSLQDCGRSGVYFRIMKPGRITKNAVISRLQRASPTFTIFELYPYLVQRQTPPPEVLQRAIANGAFPQFLIEKWMGS